MAMIHYEPTYVVNRAVHTAPLSYGSGYGRRVPVVELIVPMCCTKCQEKIRESMLELRGTQSVLADLQTQRVVVTGFVDPIKVLKKARKVKRDSVLYTARASGYGGDYLTKYRRSEYRPSLYRTSSYELRRPPVYRTSSLEYRPASVYRTSLNQVTPYAQSYVYRPSPVFESSYSDGYSPVITNPHYFKHVESEYYWRSIRLVNWHLISVVCIIPVFLWMCTALWIKITVAYTENMFQKVISVNCLHMSMY